MLKYYGKIQNNFLNTIFHNMQFFNSQLIVIVQPFALFVMVLF